MLATKKIRLKGLLANLALLTISLLISLAAGELYLRSQGHEPGFIPRYGEESLRPVETLEVSENYFTDREGVFKANPDGDWDGAFTINADGFRSVPFTLPPDKRSRILLLGDSFAWGASAEPITDSFADILAREGYRVFNTGIPGTGPQQYAHLARKYAPVVKPDIVAVVFYMGNDIREPRPMLPHKNLFHITNVGWLAAYDNGIHMTAQEAYETYLARGNEAHPYLHDERDTLKARVKRFLMRSALGTNLWVRLSQLTAQLQQSANGSPATQVDSGHTDGLQQEKLRKFSRDYLLEIKAVAEQQDAHLMLFVVPVNPELEDPGNSVQANGSVFAGLGPRIPENLTRADYSELPDDHFNNQGHRKFAEFMLEALRRQDSHRGR